MPHTQPLIEKFPNLEIRTFTERLGAKFNGKIIKGEDLNLLTKTNDTGEEIYFIVIDPLAQKMVMDLRGEKEKVDINTVKSLQEAASYWAQVDDGMLTYTPPPSENKNYIVCELNYDAKNDSFFVKKPDERAIINGKGVTGRAVFAYTNERGELVYIFANKNQFGGSLTSWGGKAELSDLFDTNGLEGKALENKAIANAARRETIEEIDMTKLLGLVERATPVNLERAQAAVEANGNTLNTANVVLYLGKVETSIFAGILATAEGQSEGIEGLVHIKASCLANANAKLSLEALFGMDIMQVESLKGKLIPDEILSVMSHKAFASGVMTQEAIDAITTAAGRRIDHPALTSLKDADNMVAINDAIIGHTIAEEKVEDEKKDENAEENSVLDNNAEEQGVEVAGSVVNDLD